VSDLPTFLRSIIAEIQQAQATGTTADTLMEVPIGDMLAICQEAMRAQGAIRGVDMRPGDSVEVVEGEPVVVVVHGLGLLGREDDAFRRG
jgi:hypothetical protein